MKTSDVKPNKIVSDWVGELLQPKSLEKLIEQIPSDINNAEHPLHTPVEGKEVDRDRVSVVQDSIELAQMVSTEAINTETSQSNVQQVTIEDLSVFNVTSLKSQLIQSVSTQETVSVSLDFSALTDFDSAGIQLIYRFNHYCIEKGKTAILKNIPIGLQESLSLIGLEFKSVTP